MKSKIFMCEARSLRKGTLGSFAQQHHKLHVSRQRTIGVLLGRVCAECVTHCNNRPIIQVAPPIVVKTPGMQILEVIVREAKRLVIARLSTIVDGD